MPEGDTIFRVATRLRQFEGCLVEDASAREDGVDADCLVNRHLQSVEARGKHLLMHLEGERVIHSHMGMTGSWHVYAAGETWHKAHWQAHLVLHTDRAVLVCFTPKLLELLTEAQVRRHRWLTRLGPDLLANGFEEAEALRRMRIHNATPIGEAVMNQSIVCGIGNIYKSEILFLTNTHPLTRVGELSDEQLQQILTLARKLMKRNRNTHDRRTRFRGDGNKLWAYERADQPCWKCGTTIALTRQGDLGRTTFYCPSCQAKAAAIV